MRTFQACRAVFLIMLLGAAAIAASAQTLTTLHNFVGSEGALPAAPLLLGHDGNYYGTTYAGGVNGYGNVFKMTPSGSVTNLYSFCSQTYCADGYSPEAALVLGSDGNFYGTAAYGAQGGGSGAGAVFKISAGGTYTVLYKFCHQAKLCRRLQPIFSAAAGHRRQLLRNHVRRRCKRIWRRLPHLAERQLHFPIQL